MTVRKRTISFDASLLAAAEQLSAERGCNLSAFVNAAVKHRLKVEGGWKLVADDTEQHGPTAESVVGKIDEPRPG